MKFTFRRSWWWALLIPVVLLALLVANLAIISFPGTVFSTPTNPHFWVPKHSLSIICNTSQIQIEASPTIADLPAELPQIISTCGRNAHTDFYYGNGQHYSVEFGYSPLFSGNDTYIVTRIVKVDQSVAFQDLTIALYKETESGSYTTEFSEDYGNIEPQTTPSGTPDSSHTIQFKTPKDSTKLSLYVYSPFVSGDNGETSFSFDTAGTLYILKSERNHSYYGYTIDSNSRVLYYDKEVEADPKTFRFISTNFAADQNNLYLDGVKVSDTFDLNSFRVIFDQILHIVVADKNGVYLYQTEYPPNLANKVMKRVTVPNADPFTIKAVPSFLYEYFEDKNHVYKINVNSETCYSEKDCTVKASTIMATTPDADPNTFYYIGYGYSKDETHVYYEGSLLPLADSATFGVFEDPNSGDTESLGISDDPYAKDKNHVFMKDQVLSGADPNTFVPLQGGYSADAHNLFHIAYDIYTSSSTSTHVDMTTFPIDIQSLETWYEEYAKDKNSVFSIGEKLPEADPATFTVTVAGDMDPPYAIDKNFEYLPGQPDKKVSPDEYKTWPVYNGFTYYDGLKLTLFK